MTLVECKEQVAKELGWISWNALEFSFPDDQFAEILDKATTLYAIEKVKEALTLAADLIHTYDDGHDEDGNAVQSINYDIFPALETELIENIKNEK